MNAPFKPHAGTIRLADLGDVNELRRLDAFVLAHPHGTPFHRPCWFVSVAQATGNRAFALVEERGGEVVGLLPLDAIHSPVFGRVLASSGFAVGGGLLATPGADPAALFRAAKELALRLSCPAIELRGGALPDAGGGWTLKTESHCNFARPLAADDEAELLAIPRKQRAEVRRSLGIDLDVRVGREEGDRAAHYAVFCESYRNLGTPVFPRALLDSVLDGFGADADILTVWHQGRPVAGVLSLYHDGAVMPYWGGGTRDARALRANDRMYYELMLHARRKGCARFDFGRSKTLSGAYHFKRNWGFEPEPLTYAGWTAPGALARDADPTSARVALQIRLWQKLPLAIANRLGPLIARGIG
ncbi:FemAB family XrtA/PEP-CTERM system-associated protein [Novosphingobium colocasiae]|uniref:Peptidoglycan bridge formation protein FemAB n=1 Tax=Novosphingobium colocasiae TaxID=1256513 RepID=A0A918UHF3_9SPHN|nr:FemAB family XrtA/PEP-CTERM system-associated protein [Novosphingobium colocasiae]GGZ08462.1 peptidoglycan bridge formation protein FemAB [Novosphingobium colocasiae]